MSDVFNEGGVNHLALLDSAEERKKLIETFAPSWFYHRSEMNFPSDPEEIVKNTVIAKRDEYIKVQQGNAPRNLTAPEVADREWINRFFFKNNEFNTDYYKAYLQQANHLEFNKNNTFEGLRDPALNGEKTNHFLVFDEKRYGYKVGEKIDVDGVSPFGYPKHDANKQSAPLFASIIPTEEGFFINYQFIYALNHALVGTQWLRRILPASVCNLFDNFGFHYGDAEGVGIHVKYNSEAKKFEVSGMQTFAHGRKGARYVPVEECKIDNNGRVCVYVGSGGHPAYADNFTGRNKYLDLVGEAYCIEPTNVVDVSTDLLERAFNQDRIIPGREIPEENGLEAMARAVPRSLMMFRRFADSNPLTHDLDLKTAEHVERLAKTHNNYRPLHTRPFFAFFYRLWTAIVHFFTGQEVRREAATFHWEGGEPPRVEGEPPQVEDVPPQVGVVPRPVVGELPQVVGEPLQNFGMFAGEDEVKANAAPSLNEPPTGYSPDSKK